jgi:hypothetical protein
LGLLEAGRTSDGGAVVRLSALGKWVLGLAELPPRAPTPVKTLVVQPNLEILVYRQGLTPALVASLSRFATWTSLGPACTLRLEPESVYRALESGSTFDWILGTLERHGMRATPVAVVESLRTWSNKRERLSVYPGGALLEFADAQDLEAAMGRGLAATRLSDRLAVAANEDAIDYRMFRLNGARDYGLPPERCIMVEPDGVTLTIDFARADLLAEPELMRFAQLVPTSGAAEMRQYRISPQSLSGALNNGLGRRGLEEWFLERTGRPLPAAVQLLIDAPATAPVEVRRRLILHVSTPLVADGLMQLPATRSLVAGRLGPTALIVADDQLQALRQQLGALGIQVVIQDPASS